MTWKVLIKPQNEIDDIIQLKKENEELKKENEELHRKN